MNDEVTASPAVHEEASGLPATVAGCGVLVAPRSPRVILCQYSPWLAPRRCPGSPSPGACAAPLSVLCAPLRKTSSRTQTSLRGQRGARRCQRAAQGCWRACPGRGRRAAGRGRGRGRGPGRAASLKRESKSESERARTHRSSNQTLDASAPPCPQRPPSPPAGSAPAPRVFPRAPGTLLALVASMC
jgi:hypothetical protein